MSVKIEGLDKVIERVQERLNAFDGESQASVVVGYEADYSVWVHENLEAYHPVGQAKFLEQPAREYADEIGEVIRDQLLQGKSPSQALMVGGLMLQAESQALVPVDTGNLKNSAFTRIEQG